LVDVVRSMLRVIGRCTVSCCTVRYGVRVMEFVLCCQGECRLSPLSITCCAVYAHVLLLSCCHLIVLRVISSCCHLIVLRVILCLVACMVTCGACMVTCGVYSYHTIFTIHD
jgi:hypothetical protein